MLFYHHNATQCVIYFFGKTFVGLCILSYLINLTTHKSQLARGRHGRTIYLSNFCTKFSAKIRNILFGRHMLNHMGQHIT